MTEISTTQTTNMILQALQGGAPVSSDNSVETVSAITTDTASISADAHTLLLKDKLTDSAQMMTFVTISGEALDTVTGYLSQIRDEVTAQASGTLTADETATSVAAVATLEAEMSSFIGDLYHGNNLDITLKQYSGGVTDNFMDVVALSDDTNTEIGSITALEVDFEAMISSMHADTSISCPHCAQLAAQAALTDPATGQETALETTVTTSTVGSQVVTSAAGDTNQSIIDTLLLGTKWDVDTAGGETLTYSYYDPSTGGYDPNYNGGSGVPGGAAIHAVNDIDAGNEASLNEMFNLWDDVLGIDFTEVNETTSTGEIGEIRVAFTDDGVAYGRAAFAYQPGNASVNGDVWFETADNTAFDSSGIGSDGYSFRSALHEVGHAIGLSHPFDSSSVTGLNLSDAQDIMRNTFMSYTNVDRNRMLAIEITDLNGTNTYTYDELENITVTGAYSISYTTVGISASTPMPYDILAAQFLYGASTDTRVDDTAYTFADTPQTIQTIFDSDGIDVIDASNQTRSSVINLTAGSFSSIGLYSATDQIAALNANISGAAAGIETWLDTAFDNRSDAVSADMSAASLLYTGEDNVAIAYGVEIENAYGGAGDDTITGNNLNNLIVGGAGDDLIDGGTGDADIVKFSGDLDDYTINTSGGTTTITDNTAGRDGTDTVTNVEYFQFTESSPLSGFMRFDATLQNFATDVTFDLTVDGTTQTVTLAAKDYTGLTEADFAADLDTAIDAAFGGDSVSVTVNSPLTITSNSTGSSSSVALSNATDATLQTALGITDATGTGSVTEAGQAAGSVQYYDVAAGTVSSIAPSGAAGAGTSGTSGGSSSGSSSSYGVTANGEIYYPGSVASIDLTSREGATAAISIIDRALESINSLRSDLGATSNRLDYAISSMGHQIVNTEASQSRIEDADMAAEMAKLVKNQVLQQAAMQILGMSNKSSQQVLSLMQG